ncbi:MAG: hypothetical protein N4A70_01685 [Pelagimonas sp.]|jgi:hypothetical protein|nr:hypothetical protein [Pelagimonas sp.]
MKKSIFGGALASLALTLSMAGQEAAAQTVETVQAPQQKTTFRAFPGTFGAPSAVAAPGKTGFVSATLSTPRDGIKGKAADGDFALGYTIGNPVDNVSLTFGVAITGTNPVGDAGSFFLSASRLVRAGGKSATFVGVSAGNLGTWGPTKGSKETYSFQVSHLTAIDSKRGEFPVQITLGYGTNTKRKDDGSGKTEEGVVLGVGVGLAERLSVSMSATQTQLNVGMSTSIPGLDRVGITAGVYDVTENTKRRQFALSAGYSF